MNTFNDILTDELVEFRIRAREMQIWNISDIIRNVLDSRGSFVMDTSDGQVVYHMGQQWGNKRVEFIKQFINIDLQFKVNAVLQKKRNLQG